MLFEVGQSLSPNLKGLCYNPNQFSWQKIGMIDLYCYLELLSLILSN